MSSVLNEGAGVARAPDTALRRPWWFKQQVNLAFLAAFVALLLVCWYAVRSIQSFIETSDWVAHTYRVIGSLEQTSEYLTTANSSIRAYVVTGDEQFISQRDEAISQLESALQNLKSLVADNPVQLARTARLETLLTYNRASLDAILIARQTQGFNAAEKLVAARVRDANLIEVKSSLNALKAMENELLNRRQQQNLASVRELYGLGAMLMLVALATISLGIWRLRHELAERGQLLRLVEESKRFLDSVVEHIPNMLFVKDARTLRYVRMNQAGERILGVTRDQVIGRDPFQVHAQAQAQALVAADREALAQGVLLDIAQENFNTHDQGVRVMHTRKLVIRDDRGEPAYLLDICEDITERVENERHIIELNARLEQQKAELEASNKDLEGFSYSVSHDLRAPLRAVDSFALMLEEDYGQGLDDEARRYIRVIRDGAQRMGRLIDDLLSFSRVGRLNFRVGSVDMTSLARTAAEQLLAPEPAAAVELQIHELPVGCGDASVLCQVWSNLLGNAVKYSSKRPIAKIEVSGEMAGGEAVYHVRDNGAGFDMRYYNKLFGVFQRLHRTEEFTGTGVGLAIVHRIITRHGGRVWAEGIPDGGATFHFTLPVGDNA